MGQNIVGHKDDRGKDRKKYTKKGRTNGLIGNIKEK